MSLSKIITQNCPNCNSEEQIKLHQSVNVTIDPGLKNRVLNGKLNTVNCSNCKREIDVISGLLYHDMKSKIILELKVTDEQDEGKSKILEEFKSKGYICREIYSYPELVEKINVFDNNLNDLVIESVAKKLKIMLEESFKEVTNDDSDVNMYIFFKKIEKGIFKKKISFHCFSHPSQMMEVKYDFKNLTDYERKNLNNMEALRN